MRGDVIWVAALCLAVALLLLLNPGGYIGGGQDDFRYLKAVRCWREYGPCLPYNHWQSRWPLIAPTAALTSFLGESRLTISLAPCAASVLALVMVAAAGNRLFGRPVGWIGSLIFCATPAFSFQFTDLMVEGTELLSVGFAFLAVLEWQKSGRRTWALAAGLAWALAFQARETSSVAIFFAAIYVLMSEQSRKAQFLIYASIGFGLPLIAEFATFAVTTGDPLWRRRLALDHTQIPSSELIGPIDTHHGPLLNLAYIAHWKRVSGIHVHWLVDWLLNLLVSGFAGVSLALVPLLLIAFRKRLDGPARRRALLLWLAGLGYAAVLALVFAVDPKPRIMLVPLALTSMALAVLTWRARQAGYGQVAILCWLAVFLLWLPLHAGHRRTDIVEGSARSWISARADQIEIDENTRRHLALVRQAALLPGIAAERKYLLYMSSRGCNELSGSNGLGAGNASIVGSSPVNRFYLGPQASRTELCLLRFNRVVTGNELVAAIRARRSDGRYITGYGGD